MKKTNAKYIILVLVALFTIGGFLTLKFGTEQKTLVMSAQVQEPAIARIDLSTAYTPNEKFIVYGENENEKLIEADGMSKFGTRGYTIQKEGIKNEFIIKVIDDTNIKLALRGKWDQDNDKNMIEHWVDFTSLIINGEELLPEKTAVWYNKPFNHIIKAKAGETYTVSAKWQKHVGTEDSE